MIPRGSAYMCGGRVQMLHVCGEELQLHEVLLEESGIIMHIGSFFFLLFFLTKAFEVVVGCVSVG
jgi:hypothetical protein